MRSLLCKAWVLANFVRCWIDLRATLSYIGSGAPIRGLPLCTSLVTTTPPTTPTSISSPTTTPPLLTVPPGHLYLIFFFEVSTRQKTYVTCSAWHRNLRVLGCLIPLRLRTASFPCSMANLIHTRSGGKGSTSTT